MTERLIRVAEDTIVQQVTVNDVSVDVTMDGRNLAQTGRRPAVRNRVPLRQLSKRRSPTQSGVAVTLIPVSRRYGVLLWRATNLSTASTNS